MPWVQQKRERLSEDGQPNPTGYLDCEVCLEYHGEIQRGRWSCGRLPSRKTNGPGFPLSVPFEKTECPGRLIALPQVIETARANLWFEKGQLRERYDGEELTGALMDCVEIFQSAIGESQAARMREVRDGNR